MLSTHFTVHSDESKAEVPDYFSVAVCICESTPQAVTVARPGFIMGDVEQEYGGNTFDCQGTPGNRCINTVDDDGTGQLFCMPSSCSDTGQVLIDGFVCAGEPTPSSPSSEWRLSPDIFRHHARIPSGCAMTTSIIAP